MISNLELPLVSLWKKPFSSYISYHDFLPFIGCKIVWAVITISSLSCDREFTDCRLQTCFVQSPNFPGVYPRNRRCLYHVSTRQPFIKVSLNDLLLRSNRIQFVQHDLTANYYVTGCSFSQKTASSMSTANDATITSCVLYDPSEKNIVLTTISG